MSHELPGDGVRCDHCDQPGRPYTYRGRNFPGLHANRGERLCSRCLGEAVQAEWNTPVGWAQVPAREYVSPRYGGRSLKPVKTLRPKEDR
jgi:hypothetical protein